MCQYSANLTRHLNPQVTSRACTVYPTNKLSLNPFIIYYTSIIFILHINQIYINWCCSCIENLALEASSRGLAVHGIQGFDYERARTDLEVPDNFGVMLWWPIQLAILEISLFGCIIGIRLLYLLSIPDSMYVSLCIQIADRVWLMLSCIFDLIHITLCELIKRATSTSCVHLTFH